MKSKLCHHFMTMSFGSAYLSDVPLPRPFFKRMENIRNCLQGRMRTHLPHCKARHLCLHKKFEKTQDKTVYMRKTSPDHCFPQAEATFPQVRAQLAETEHILKTHPGPSHQWDELLYYSNLLIHIRLN